MFLVAHAVGQATFSLTVEATSAVFFACSTASLLVEYDRRHLQRLAGASPSFIVARHGYHLTVLIAQPFLHAEAYHPSQVLPKPYEYVGAATAAPSRWIIVAQYACFCPISRVVVHVTLGRGTAAPLKSPTHSSSPRRR